MAELLRNAINDRAVTELGERISQSYKSFRAEEFADCILERLHDLTLTERIDLTTENLEMYLTDDFPAACRILVDSLGEELDAEADDPVAKDYSSNCGFIVVPLTSYVARHGMKHFDISMHALFEMTKRFSSEGAIRHFIKRYQNRTLSLFHTWTEDANVHVRRLVSESTRPRLPWAMRLPQFIQDPAPVISLLEKLKDDKHLYVRRSVANNLNDISKDNP